MGPNVPVGASRARLPFSTAGVEGVRPAWPRGAQWFGLASSAQKAGQSLTDWHENIGDYIEESHFSSEFPS